MSRKLSTSFLVLNPNVAPFDNRDLRLAMTCVSTAQGSARMGLEGRVRIGGRPDAAGHRRADWPSNLPAYNLDAARQALAAAGTLDTRPAIYESGGGVVGTLKAVLARDLGLEIDAVDVPWEQFTGLMTSRSLPAFELTWVADYPDPEDFIGALFDSHSPDNYIGYSNPQVDALLAQAERELDPATRADLFLQAQQLIVDDGVLLPLYHDVSYTLIKPWVRGLTETPIGVVSLESVWIER